MSQFKGLECCYRDDLGRWASGEEIMRCKLEASPYCDQFVGVMQCRRCRLRSSGVRNRKRPKLPGSLHETFH